MSGDVIGDAVSSWRDRNLFNDRPDHLGRLFTPRRQFALCLGHAPDLWFPVESDGGADAVAICSACPVRIDCLGWAIDHNEREGIWGGVSARRRKRMRGAALAAGRAVGSGLLGSEPEMTS